MSSSEDCVRLHNCTSMHNTLLPFAIKGGTEHGELVSPQQARRARDEGHPCHCICPICRSKVFEVIPQKHIDHFRHGPNARCPLQPEATMTIKEAAQAILQCAPLLHCRLNCVDCKQDISAGKALNVQVMDEDEEDQGIEIDFGRFRVKLIVSSEDTASSSLDPRFRITAAEVKNMLCAGTGNDFNRILLKHRCTDCTTKWLGKVRTCFEPICGRQFMPDRSFHIRCKPCYATLVSKKWADRLAMEVANNAKEANVRQAAEAAREITRKRDEDVRVEKHLQKRRRLEEEQARKASGKAHEEQRKIDTYIKPEEGSRNYLYKCVDCKHAKPKHSDFGPNFLAPPICHFCRRTCTLTNGVRDLDDKIFERWYT